MGICDLVIFEIPSLQLARDGFEPLFLKELHSEGRLDHPTLLRVELAFQEALANSLEHGNLELQSSWKEEIDPVGVDKFSLEKERRLRDPSYSSRKLQISFRCDEHGLEICIGDEGKGFDLSRVQLSQSVESYGRGLAMIKANMDEVLFEESGRRIKMIKRFTE